MTINENPKSTLSGGVAILLILILAVVGPLVVLPVAAQGDHGPLGGFAVVVLELLAFVGLFGLMTINPGQAKVLQLMGNYVGTVKTPGFHWVNPFYTKRAITLRAISFESGHIKVNDIDGNPIEIAAIVIWRIIDTAQASFQVADCAKYVQMQAEAALRNMVQSYPYDGHDDEKESLRGSTAKIADHLKSEINDRAKLAGVEIMEARISHLVYAPEIAHAMLQRQQAGAIIAARAKIVDGAVGMVEMALERLARNKVVTLDEGRKAQMVANLLVVLCGERATQPTINTGS